MKPTTRRTELALIVLSLFSATTGAAQEAIVQDAPVVAEEKDQDLERDLERILYTQWGMPIRTRAKMVDGAWQIRSGKDWRALPDGTVTKHVLVRDIKRESRARERKLKMALADDRADQALWLID